MEIIVTNDKSHTVRSTVWGELYHSKYGAVIESEHVFLQHGLRNVIFGVDNLRVFEMGFGTGLNVFLSAQKALHYKKKIHFETVESNPISKEIWTQLNYSGKNNPAEQQLFDSLHNSEWNTKVSINPYFDFTKHLCSVEDLPEIDPVHVIYYDAFAPSCQEELWTEEIFSRMYNMLVPGGLLTTYCAKGYVKRNLKAVGFRVEAVPGPPGKREMTTAYRD